MRKNEYASRSNIAISFPLEALSEQILLILVALALSPEDFEVGVMMLYETRRQGR